MRSILLVVFALLAAYSDVDAFLTAKQKRGVIDKDTNFQTRAGVSFVPYSKYPFMTFIPLETTTCTTCFILSNYTCAISSYYIPRLGLPGIKIYSPANDSISIDSGTLHPVENVIMHPKFNTMKIEYWIWIITVSVPFNTPVVPLPPANAVLLAGTVMTAVGFSSNNHSLIEYYVEVVDDSVCVRDPYFGNAFLPGKTICIQDFQQVDDFAAYFYNGSVYGQTHFKNGNLSFVQPFSNAVSWLRGC